jgi:hypothetical protein
MSNEVLVPDPTHKIRTGHDPRQTQVELDRQFQITASVAVNVKGPEFWKQFVRESTLNAEGISMVDLRGQVSNLGRPEVSSEEHCRIDVTRSGLFPLQVYTSMFYIPAGLGIRCHTSESASFTLGFAARPDESVGVTFGSDTKILSEKDAAEMVIGRMVAMVRAQSE